MSEQPPAKVLLVEDSSPQRKVARTILEELGLDHEIEYDGRGGLDALLADEDITHLITDNNMPIMDGSVLLKSLCRQHPERLKKLIHIIFKSQTFFDGQSLNEEINRIRDEIRRQGVSITLIDDYGNERDSIIEILQSS